MNWTLLGTLLSLVAVAFVLLPLFQASRHSGHISLPTTPSRRRVLREEKASMLLALRELDFDYEMKKLSATDYKDLRAKYETRAVQVLRELEKTEEAWKEIEASVSAALHPKGSAPTSATTAGAKYCAACGKQLAPQARFCGGCGAQTATAAHA